MEDRGTKKWVSLMMPEHVQMLQDYWESTEWKDKPVLDDQQLNEINNKLQMAIHKDLTIQVKYFKDHDFSFMRGKLFKVDSLNKEIVFQNGNRERIKFEDIIDVTIL